MRVPSRTSASGRAAFPSVWAAVLPGPDAVAGVTAGVPGSRAGSDRLSAFRARTERHTDDARAGVYSNQSKATAPSVAYMPITRPVKPQATSVDR